MPRTYPRILFGDTSFEAEDFVSARLTEEFSPLSIVVPVSELEFSVYSDDLSFSIINPTGDFEALATHRPMALYVVVDGVQQYLGQFYLDNWSNRSETIKQFTCIDILGMLDKYTYLGGIWLTATTVGKLVADVLDALGIGYEIDPYLADVELTGWIPIVTCREALQQIAFAAGAYVLSARRDSIVFGRLSQVTFVTYGPRTGVFGAGQSRTYSMRWRGAQEYIFSTGVVITQGIRSGVPHTGQSRVWQQRFRASQWEGVMPVVDIPSSDQAGRKVTLRPQVTGVELTGHDIIAGNGSQELLNQNMPVGTHEIHFSQPMHTLSITGGTITESGANYAIINVATAGTVILTGLVYVVTDTLYAEYLPPAPNRKDNIINIVDATLVNSTNGAAICKGVFDYYQQRYSQKMRLFSPSAYVQVGATVNAETLYGNYLYGVVEKANTNLFGGNVAELDAVGIIT